MKEIEIAENIEIMETLDTNIQKLVSGNFRKSKEEKNIEKRRNI